MNFLTIEKNGNRMRTTQASWDLRGADKNGWKIVSDSEQPAEKPQSPPTGQKVKNTVGNESEQSSEQPAEKPQSPDPEVEAKFRDTLSDVSKSIQASFLDKVGIKYQPNANKTILGGLIGNHLGWDISLLKKEFNIE